MRITPFSLATALALASHSVLADSTVYGVFNAALESVSATGASAGSASDVRQTQRVTSNTSKIGFKGNEDLGNGLKALWQVEQEVSIDDGGARKGAWAGCNSFVGLEGGFGKVLLGNHDSAYKMFGDSGTSSRAWCWQDGGAADRPRCRRWVLPRSTAHDF